MAPYHPHNVPPLFIGHEHCGLVHIKSLTLARSLTETASAQHAHGFGIENRATARCDVCDETADCDSLAYLYVRREIRNRVHLSIVSADLWAFNPYPFAGQSRSDD